MIKKKIIGFFLSICISIGLAQVPSSYNFFTSPPGQITQISTSVNGQLGQSTYYYFVVAQYPVGRSQVSSLGVIATNVSNNLSSLNNVQVSWNGQVGAIGYDVLRLTTPFFPGSGQCTGCLIATSIAATSYTDISNSTLGSYTLSPAIGASGSIVLDNRSYSLPRYIWDNQPQFDIDLSRAQHVFLPGGLPIGPCTATTSGLVPTPPNNTTTFLRGDCTFSSVAGGSPPINSTVIGTNGLGQFVSTTSLGVSQYAAPFTSTTPGTVQASGLTPNLFLHADTTFSSLTITQPIGDASSNAANTVFVANALSSINPAVAVQASTNAVLPNTPIYNNGTGGVGATLTAGSNGALVIDGYTVLLNDRILVKNQVTNIQNGVYTITTLGTGGVPYVLTRAIDYNTPTNINYTGDIPVLQGTTCGGDTAPPCSYLLVNQIVAVGTSPLTYSLDVVNPTGPPGGKAKTCATNFVAFSATPTYDLSRGCLQTITLTANVTSSTVTNGISGTTYTFLICQNAIGNFTHAWPTTFLATMTIGSTASQCSTQAFVYNGTSFYAVTPGVINE